VQTVMADCNMEPTIEGDMALVIFLVIFVIRVASVL